MAKIVSGTFICSGSATKVDLGFVPDYVEAYSALGGTELGFKYFRCLADAATSGQYGLALANAGDISACADANNGLKILTGTSYRGVLVESPQPGIGKIKVSVQSFAAAKAASVTPTARSATVVGTVIRPTTANGLVYECTTSGGAMTSLTEPTWGTTIGGTTSDASNTWTCRMEETCEMGVMGFEVGATIATDAEIWVFKAEQHDRQGDFGDADNDANKIVNV
jgi:hypothetical protein